MCRVSVVTHCNRRGLMDQPKSRTRAVAQAMATARLFLLLLTTARATPVKKGAAPTLQARATWPYEISCQTSATFCTILSSSNTEIPVGPKPLRPLAVLRLNALTSSIFYASFCLPFRPRRLKTSPNNNKLQRNSQPMEAQASQHATAVNKSQTTCIDATGNKAEIQQFSLVQ